MSAVTFDTHAFIKRMTAAGMPSEQAEALAEEQVRITDTSRQSLATPLDLHALEAKMDVRFAKVDERFAKVEGELALLKWMLGVVVVGVLALVMKAFLHA